jgi:uncharacterized membrane protein YkoI
MGRSMKRNLILLLAGAGLGLALPLSGAAESASKPAQHPQENDQVLARAALQRGEIMPIAKVLGMASRHVPGDIVEVELERENGRFIYEVKILSSNGRLREVELDARTGALVKIEDE